MRKRILVALLASTATVLPVASATAAPRHNHGLTIAATPSTIVAGQGVFIYGSLTGSNSGGQTIELWHRINPAAQFTIVQKTTTTADGFYSFTRAEGVVVSNRNWYVTGPDASHSRTIHEHVSAQVNLTGATSSTNTSTSLITGQKQTFTGTLYPARAGATVRLQEQTAISGNGWATVAQSKSVAGGAFSLTKGFARPGVYTVRAELVGDARNITSVSDTETIVVQQKQVDGFSITTATPIIADGASATITGTDASQPNTAVTLYGAAGHGKSKAIAQATTDASGNYTFTESPTANTVYVVRAGGGHHSAALNLGVTDVVSATPSAASVSLGAPFTVTGTVTPAHTGHAIYLQEETAAGHWANIAGSSVGAGSKYGLATSFGKAGTYTLRVRIFGGPENVGAASSTFTVTVSGTPNPSALPAAS